MDIDSLVCAKNLSDIIPPTSGNDIALHGKLLMCLSGETEEQETSMKRDSVNVEGGARQMSVSLNRSRENKQ